MEPLIRERAGAILDGLPIGEEFDWVDKVSIELTTMTLATLFDFPLEDRRKLTHWSDVVTAPRPATASIDTIEQKMAELSSSTTPTSPSCGTSGSTPPPTGDLISMLAHGEATRNMEPREYLGNLVLLIVGGNDTTRNTITGAILALNQNPDQYAKLRANPDLIPSMVSETIRWQTPLAHMRRTRAAATSSSSGKTIKKGDKVVMWYVSGNRDDEVIERPERLHHRPRAARASTSPSASASTAASATAWPSCSCKIIWEEILKRFPTIEVVGEPKRVYSTFVKGYESLPVVIPARV